ncbi:MAG: twin-arginine translocation signal domain-containing protein [Alphaproteobacteria bacterium]|nr:MAG: twin-arginine translocation signal domain-containing protein [Alphaproteobacteria bacterium]
MKAEEGATRRDFLKLTGTAAPAAAALAAATATGVEAAEAEASPTRLQDTAHTRAYLASARF